MAIHFLHVRKTGGTAAKTALRPILDRCGLLLHSHSVLLPHIMPGEKVIFAVREPLSRFVSGFNSRLRKGRPRNNIEWSAGEAIAFEQFPDPNSLAEALSSRDRKVVDAAHTAMGSINHVRHHLVDWLVSADYLQTRLNDILLIILQPELDADFELLKKILKLPAEIILPKSLMSSHRTPPGFQTGLSDISVKNLTNWYRKDIDIFQECLQLRKAIIKRHAGESDQASGN